MFYKKLLTITIFTTLFYILFPYIKVFIFDILDLINSNRLEIITNILLPFLLILIMFYILCNHYYDGKEKKESTDLSPDNEFKDYDSQKVAGVKNIIDSHNDNSFFSLALIGDWGSGKSSFLKKLKEEIEDKDKDFVIYLNVWELENIQNILQEIEKEFDNIVFKLSLIEWILYHLKSILIKNYFSLLSKYFKENHINITSPFSNTIKDSKDEYNILLKKVLQDKKIVLVLDELDRLESKTDILDIFKIIRYLASFDKVFTITGVDINKLGKIDLNYIHKIFHSKYIIPKPSKEELLDFLRKERIDKLSIIEEKDFNDILNKLALNNEKCLIDFISTYREIKNMCNDTYLIYTSLKNGIHDWNNISKFIFIFNLLKAINIKLYTKFMNEEETIQLKIIDYFFEIKFEKDSEESPYKEYLKDKDILSTFSFIIKEYDNLNELLHIYRHHNIPDYMFTEVDYKAFLDDTGLINVKLANLKKNERSIYFQISTKQDKFINFLITRLDREENKDNIAKLLGETFSLYPKGKLLYIIYNKIESFRNVDYSLNTIEELWKLYFKGGDCTINNIIFDIFSRINDNSLYKILYSSLNNPLNKSYFKTSFTQYKSNLYLQTKKLFDFIKVIDEYFGEDYNTFFEDKEIYYLYIPKDPNNSDSYTLKELTGKKIKEFIDNNNELKELIKEYKDSKAK